MRILRVELFPAVASNMKFSKIALATLCLASAAEGFSSAAIKPRFGLQVRRTKMRVASRVESSCQVEICGR